MSSWDLTRRDFVRILALTTGSAVLGNCGATTAPTASPTQAPAGSPTEASTVAPSAGQPKYGGILTCKIAADPPNFDPIQNTTSSLLIACAPCYSNLVRYNPMKPEEVVGDLAQGWEISPDGKAYTFKLVQGVTFHDGKPLTSADVKYTFDVVGNPPEGVTSSRQGNLGVVDTIETLDDYTVRFNLQRPSPALLNILASGWMPVIPKHIHEQKGHLKDDLIGSGPFRLKEYLEGVSIELEKNPDYYVEGRPYLDGVKVYIVPDRNTAYGYLSAGEILLYDEMPATDARRAETELADKVVFQTVAALSSDGLSVNTQRAPWDDIRVRQAVSLAVDREESVKVIMKGEATVGGFMPSGQWALSASELDAIPGHGKDIEANRARAKELLAEAGYADGLPATITVRKGAGTHEDRAVFLKDQLAKVGIDLTINVQESAAYFESVQQYNFDMATTQIGALANDPDPIFANYFVCDGTVNYSRACSEEVDTLFLEQSQTMDVETRKQLTNEMETKAMNLHGYLNFYWKNKFMVYSNRVHDLILHPQADNNRQLQDVWLSEA